MEEGKETKQIELPSNSMELLKMLKFGIPEKGIEPREAAALYARKARAVELKEDGTLDLRQFSDSEVDRSSVIEGGTGQKELNIRGHNGKDYNLEATTVLAALWAESVHASNAITYADHTKREELKAFAYFDQNVQRPSTLELVMSYYSAVMLARKLEKELDIDFWQGKK